MVVAHGGMIARPGVRRCSACPTSTWPSIGGHRQLPLGLAGPPRRPSPLAARRATTWAAACRCPRGRDRGVGAHAAGPRRLARLPRPRARRARRRPATVAQRRGRRARRAGRAGRGHRLDGPPRLARADPRPPGVGGDAAGRRARARRRRHGHAALAAADGAARAASRSLRPDGLRRVVRPAYRRLQPALARGVRPDAARRRPGRAAAAPDRSASGAVPCGRARDPARHPRRGDAAARCTAPPSTPACTPDGRPRNGRRARGPRARDVALLDLKALVGEHVAERPRQPGRHALGLVGARRRSAGPAPTLLRAAAGSG